MLNEVRWFVCLGRIEIDLWVKLVADWLGWWLHRRSATGYDGPGTPIVTSC